MFGATTQPLQAWSYVGSDHGISSSVGNYVSLAMQQNSSNIFLAYTDTTMGANVNKATVRAYNGTGFDYVGPQQFTAGQVSWTSLAFDPTTFKAYLAFSDASQSNKASVMSFSGATWWVCGAACTALTSANSAWVHGGCVVGLWVRGCAQTCSGLPDLRGQECRPTRIFTQY